MAEFSGWDFTELNKELDELKVELPELDLGDLGFTGGDEMNPDDFFDDSGETKEKEPKKITVTCPECGKSFEVEV